MVERMAPALAERVLIIAEVAQAHDGSLVGRRLARGVAADALLAADDLETER
jgi:hypothetical protein